MLFWIVDNAGLLLFLLGVIALGFGAAWWVTRKRPWMIGCGVTVGLMSLIFILSLIVVTDRKQIRRDIETMADSFNAGKLDEALNYFSDEVSVATRDGLFKLTRKGLKELAQMNMGHYGLNKTRITVYSIDVEEVQRPKAKATFFVRPEDESRFARCQMGFVLTPQGEWRVDYFHVEMAVGGAKTPLIFPFGGK